MSMPEPLWINGINANAVKGGRKKMRADPKMGAAEPINIPVQLNPTTGIVSGPKGMKCGPMPHTAAVENMGGSNPLSYCPVFAVGCYTLVFFVEAAAQGLYFDTYKTVSTTSGNMGRFYSQKLAEADVVPWKRLHSLIQASSEHSEEKTKEVGHFAHIHCPAYYILEADDITMVSSVKITHVDSPEENPFTCYDVDKYNKFSAEVDKDPSLAIFEQKSEGTWYCKNECEEFPNALMVLEYQGDKIPFSMDPPMGNGSFANPVANCLFGTVSLYVHTFGMRLALKNVVVHSLKATLKTKMNKRKMMAVDEEAKVFQHFDIDMELECSGATDEIVEEARKEADLMSPSMYGVTRHIQYDVDVEKV